VARFRDHPIERKDRMMKRPLLIAAALVALLTRTAAADDFYWWPEAESESVERWYDQVEDDIRAEQEMHRNFLLERDLQDQRARELELEQRIETLERQLELERDE
jgi:hypothetical protein